MYYKKVNIINRIVTTPSMNQKIDFIADILTIFSGWD